MATTVELAQRLAPYITSVEAAMRAAVEPPDSLLTPHYGMLQYHLGWVDEAFRPINGRTGKRLRPVFLLLANQAVGGDWRQALPAAAAIELTHNFSLIHDDVEDRDAERHGRLTLWKRWGDAQAINAGDALFVLARLELSRLLECGVSPMTLAAAQASYDRACLAITEGQHLDMAFENRVDVTEAEYLRMVRGKTAALLAASTRIGAQVAEATPAMVERLTRFGEAVGLAFQIADDGLGIWGDPRLTGKQAANDIRRRKKSLPVAFAFERAQGEAARDLARLYSQSKLGDAEVARVLAILDGVGAQEHAEALADRYHEQALTLLEPLSDTEAGAALRELTRSLAGRAF